MWHSHPYKCCYLKRNSAWLFASPELFYTCSKNRWRTPTTVSLTFCQHRLVLVCGTGKRCTTHRKQSVQGEKSCLASVACETRVGHTGSRATQTLPYFNLVPPPPPPSPPPQTGEFSVTVITKGIHVAKLLPFVSSQKGN